MEESKNILLTGGAGFIGSHAYVDLCKNGYEPIIVDNFSNSKKETIKRLELITSNEVKFFDCDCTDLTMLKSIFKQQKPNSVMHFAALKSVSESEEQPLKYYKNNINSLINVLECMNEIKCNKLIFSSSATVYDSKNSLPLNENSTLGYSNPYGHSKLICEEIIREFCKLTSIKYGILRYFNPVGADESGLIGEDPKDIPNNLMPYVALVAKGKLDKVNVYGNDYNTPDGTGVRDYIHISDLISGHIASLNKLNSSDEDHIVNLGTGEGYSVLNLIESYQKASEKKIPYRFCPRRKGDIASCYSDNFKAKDYLKWSPKYNLDDMCSSSWKWICTND